MIYIIAYDIADNKRRLRVAKTLESWGYRIQESVFQLRLDTATLARVRARLVALISETDDVIHIYPICSSCADHADILGAAIAWTMWDCAGECGEGELVAWNLIGAGSWRGYSTRSQDAQRAAQPPDSRDTGEPHRPQKW